jgi:prephenate dehydrogenase
MKVAIIGAGGRMGSWFTNYFARQGMKVSTFDIKSDLQSPSPYVQVATSISNCVENADLVCVCIPVNRTPQVIRECTKSMKAGAIITEISSVKQKTFLALKHVRSDLQPICIHPMFGPGADEKKGIKILLIPVRKEEAELKIVNDIFDNAAVKVIPNPRLHDRSIAIILGLTYFTNIAFAKLISKNDLLLLKQVSGTTFGLQSLLAESILTDEPALILALIKDNPFSLKFIREYIKVASAMAKTIANKNDKDLEAELRKTKSKLEERCDLQQSYKQLYQIMDSIK